MRSAPCGFLAPASPPNAATYERIIRDRYRDLADDYLKLYPGTTLQESILAATRDALYGWTAERLVRKQAALGEPSYLYLFDHGYPAADAAGLHAFHASELPYVFGTLDRTPPYWPKIPATAAEGTLSQDMIDYWSSFVRTGAPTATHAPAWPRFDASGAFMAFQDVPKPSDGLFPGMYALQEQVVCRRRLAGDVAWNWNTGLASPAAPDADARCR